MANGIIRCSISRYATKTGTRYRVRLDNRRFRITAIGRMTASHYNRAGFKTRREAEHYAERIKRELAALEAGDHETHRTLGDLIEDYQQHGLPLLNKKDQRMRKTHLAWWRDTLGKDSPLGGINGRRIATGLDKLATKPAWRAPRGKRQANDSRTISPATVNRYRASALALFAYAVKVRHWIPENPVAKTKTAREARGRTRYLEAEEVARLSKAVDARGDPHLPLMYRLALTTGMRQGEILGIRWEHVQLEHDNAAIYLPETKNGAERTVHVTDAETLKRLRKHRMKYATTGRVFPPERSGARYAKWRAAWSKALDSAGITDFRFHDLRHTFASHAAMAGLDALQIAELTGHRSLAMVKRYSHLNPRAQADNARRALAHMMEGTNDE